MTFVDSSICSQPSVRPRKEVTFGDYSSSEVKGCSVAILNGKKKVFTYLSRKASGRQHRSWLRFWNAKFLAHPQAKNTYLNIKTY